VVKCCPLTRLRHTRVIAYDGPRRADLLLLAEWAHAFRNHRRGHCSTDDRRKKTPRTPVHRGPRRLVSTRLDWHETLRKLRITGSRIVSQYRVRIDRSCALNDAVRHAPGDQCVGCSTFLYPLFQRAE
jgi:hypothetical protein